jgi:SAM-dependent methyltransferase
MIREQETAMAAATFDPARYKQSTLEQWDEAAEAWSRWGPTLESWLGEATELMLDLTGVGAGSRVLDVAAGAGGQTIAAARRAGPGGAVLASDISPEILRYAERAAAAAGLGNVATSVLDGEDLSIEPGIYDAAISRLGLIYFPDQLLAARQQRQALRDGGRIGAIVYSTADRNEFFSIPVGIIRRRAGLPAPAPGQPGPFSLGAGGALEQLLADAGFSEIEVRRLPAPLRMSSAAECVRFEQESFGALHQMLSGLEQVERDEAWEEIRTALGAFEGSEGFVGPCELLVVAATR